MAAPIRVGVVGVGAMGERHARVYAEMPETALIGVFDPDAERACEVAARYRTASLELEDLLDRVHAASIASTTATHAAVAMQALDHGCHVLVEKPLAATLDEAGTLLAAAERRPRTLFMVGHIERFNPVVLALQTAIAGQVIRGLKFRRTCTFAQREPNSDLIYDLMIHDIDLALELVGDEIVSIDATGDALVTAQIDRAEEIPAEH